MRTVAAFVWITVVSFCAPALAKEEKAPHRDGAWVNAQLAAWSLTREDAPPFRLVAMLDVLHEGDWVTGTYALTWSSPAQWREEVRFPGYEETEGMAGAVRWRQRPTRYRPRVPWLLTSVIRSDAFPPKEPKEFRQIKAKKGRPPLACVGEACVDGFTGEPGSQEVYGMAVTFDAPAAFPLRSWPASYRAGEHGREIGRARIETLAPLGSTDEATFLPPREAIQVPACGTPTTPRATHKPFPPYPKSLVARRIEGTVQLRATVAEDGTVQDAEVTRTADRDLTKLALETVRTWRYDPAKCGDRAVPVEMWVQVDWKMGLGAP
ncbi:MAG TPA: energy transducer TonB [Candidatus Polarisedimenticolaceae bacterium]|nr:energy transducer TonB [Candidatus Polarisedimenticolaceae bacterium]